MIVAIVGLVDGEVTGLTDCFVGTAIGLVVRMATGIVAVQK